MKSRRLSKIITILNNQIQAMISEEYTMNSQSLNDEKIAQIQTTLKLIDFELTYLKLKKLDVE